MESRVYRPGILLTAVLVILAGCKREDRRFEEVSNATSPGLVRVSELHPGPADAPARVPIKSGTRNSYEENAFAVSEGKRLYDWYDCVGCHAHGGGGMGPALMDEKWIYGYDPAQVFNTIMEGRPNGMPSFAGRIGAQDTWQIVAYVRSLSSQVPADVPPARDDAMNIYQKDAKKPPAPPVNTKAP